MLLLICLFLYGDQTAEPINAQLFIDGQRIDVVDIEIKGSDDNSFPFFSEGQTESVSLYEIARIVPSNDSEVTLVFLDGEVRKGRVSSLNLTGIEDTEKGERISWLLQNIERIHLVQGRQLRSCPQGHHEEYTTDMFCPVCGSELLLGPDDEDKEKEGGVMPTNTMRLDSRDPASSAISRGN